MIFFVVDVTKKVEEVFVTKLLKCIKVYGKKKHINRTGRKENNMQRGLK